jgi:uncharacterized membrane protein
VSDRERTTFAAVEAAVGAAMFVFGGLLAKTAGLFVPWGCLLLVLGAIAVIQAVLVGLGLLRMPTQRRDRR